MEIFLDAIVWSNNKNHARFILGKTAEGKRYKFRYYPKKEFIGYHLSDCPHYLQGSKCLLIYRESTDGAMDVISAFPIPLESSNPKNAIVEKNSTPLSLVERINLIKKSM